MSETPTNGASQIEAVGERERFADRVQSVAGAAATTASLARMRKGPVYPADAMLVRALRDDLDAILRDFPPATTEEG